MVCHRGAAAGRLRSILTCASAPRACGPRSRRTARSPRPIRCGGRRVLAAHRLAATRRGHGARGDCGRGLAPRSAVALDGRDAGLDVSAAQPSAAPVAAPRVPVDEVNLMPSKMLTDFWKGGRPRRRRRRAGAGALGPGPSRATGWPSRLASRARLMDEVDLVPSKMLIVFWSVVPAARANPGTPRATALVGAKRRRRSQDRAARRAGQANSKGWRKTRRRRGPSPGRRARRPASAPSAGAGGDRPSLTSRVPSADARAETRAARRAGQADSGGPVRPVPSTQRGWARSYLLALCERYQLDTPPLAVDPRLPSQGGNGRVAGVPRTLVEGLFSEPRRGDDFCRRASQARPQELISTARGPAGRKLRTPGALPPNGLSSPVNGPPTDRNGYCFGFSDLFPWV